jgi:hypothetical protein
MIKCRECGHECSATNALGYHLRKHGISYTDYVVKHEHSGVWPTCKCGKRLEHKKGGFPRYCSVKCSSSGESNGMHGLRGEKSPNWGLKRTEEQLKNYSEGALKRWQLHGEKLREMMKSDEYRQAQSEANRYSYANSDRAEKVSKSVREFWSTSPLAATLRLAASDRAVRLLAEGKIGPSAPFKQEWKRNPWTGADEWMHSSWESAFMDAAIARGYEVRKDHGITIPYTHPDGSERTYVPDFYAPEDRVLYEVKGRWDAADIAKWEAAQAWCHSRGWEFCVLFGPNDE